MTTHRIPVIAIAAALVALAGCGSSGGGSSTTSSTRTVDDASVEQGITKQLSTTANPVTKASCPSDVDSQTGAKFKCSVTWSNGATGKVEVTQTGPNSFTYTIVSGSVMVPGSVVEASLKKDLAAQGAPNAVVNCPDNIIVKVGTTVTCNVSSASGNTNGTVTFTFSSASGTVDSSSVKTSS